MDYSQVAIELNLSDDFIYSILVILNDDNL